jgi:hypothetical protein
MAGFVIVGLRNTFALVAVFLLATVVAAVGRAGFAAAVQRHPYLSAAAAVIIATALVIGFIFVTSPGYVGRRLLDTS